MYGYIVVSRTQYDTPIPLEHECTTNSQCSPSFSIGKGCSTVCNSHPNVVLHTYEILPRSWHWPTFVESFTIAIACEIPT